MPTTVPMSDDTAAIHALLTDYTDAWGHPLTERNAALRAGVARYAPRLPLAARLQRALDARAAMHTGTLPVDYSLIVTTQLGILTADHTTPEPGDRMAFCGTCRRYRIVEDTDEHASAMTSRGEVEAVVTFLNCGHGTVEATSIVAPAPGAPYAPGAHPTIGDAQRAGRRHSDA